MCECDFIYHNLRETWNLWMTSFTVFMGLIESLPISVWFHVKFLKNDKELNWNVIMWNAEKLLSKVNFLWLWIYCPIISKKILFHPSTRFLTLLNKSGTPYVSKYSFGSKNEKSIPSYSDSNLNSPFEIV